MRAAASPVSCSRAGNPHLEAHGRTAMPGPDTIAFLTTTGRAVLWTAIAYFSGAIMFSWLIARVFLGVDLTRIGDDNPGAYHLFRVGGSGWGLLGAALDVAKAAAPILAASRFGVSGWALLPVMVAPLVGHSYPPWPRLSVGGHGLSVSFGVWFATTGLVGPVVLFVSDWFFQYVLVAPTDGWSR